MNAYFKTTLIILLTFATWNNSLYSQITLAFQGGEVNDTWAFVSTGASSVATTQANNTANYKTGTKSIVVGGLNVNGGNCFSGGGSGNGSIIENKFTFNSISIATSSNYARTLTFSYGNRLPICSGTGYDSGEDLIFTPFHDGVAQASVTMETGVSDLSLNIKTHQYSYTVPACVQQFYFEVKITTNRSDELLFLDDVKLVTPQLNTTNPTLSAISGNTTICEGITNSYQVDPLANVTYQWSGLPATATFITPNNTSTSNVMNINWGTTAPGNYTISVTPNFQNCATTMAGTPQTITIQVVENPIIAINGPSTFCVGNPISLTASGATTYLWGNSLGTNATITDQPTTTTTYSVSGTTNGCTSSATKTVTLSSPSIILSATKLIICEGDSSILSSNSTDPIVWSNSLNSDLSTDAFYTVSPSTTTTYTASTMGNGCNASGTITIQVEAKPTVNFTAQNLQSCSPLSTQFTNTTEGNVTFHWSFGDGSNSADINPSHVYVTPTCYTVSLSATSQNGCSATKTLVDYVCAFENPIANFTPSVYQIDDWNSTVNFTNNSTAATSSLWRFGHLSTSIETNPEFTFPKEGIDNYSVTLIVTNDHGCIDSITKIIQYEEQLIYYIPNAFTPDGNELNQTFSPVFTSGFDPYNFVMRIFNRWGELIFETKNHTEGWSGLTITDQMAPVGTYTYQVVFNLENSDDVHRTVGSINLLR